jgi:hypothetical protein
MLFKLVDLNFEILLKGEPCAAFALKIPKLEGILVKNDLNIIAQLRVHVHLPAGYPSSTSSDSLAKVSLDIGRLSLSDFDFAMKRSLLLALV